MDGTSACHRALQTPKIVTDIAAELQEDRQTLCQRSRVSTSFRQTCTAFLWSSVNLGSLLSLLPKRLIRIENHPTSLKYVFQRTPANSDWVKLKPYSSHTASLYIHASQYPPNFGTLLAKTNNALFPKLKQLEIDDITSLKDIPMDLLLIARSSLRRLKISGADAMLTSDLDHTRTLASLFQYIKDQVPNLTYLQMSHLPIFAKFEREVAFPEAICARLRTFQWVSDSPIPVSILSSIAFQPAISSIVLSRLTQWPSSLDSSCFPSLRVLDLKGNGTAIGKCFGAIHRPAYLTHLTVDCEDTGVSTHIFQQLWPSPPNAHSLTNVHIHIRWRSAAWDLFKVLLYCRSLTELSLTSEGILLGLNDAALKELASNLRRLQSLRLVLDEGGPYEATIYGLGSFAAFCPDLQELIINVTTRVVPPNSLHPHSTIYLTSRQHSLGSLGLGQSEINDQADTEDFLGPRKTARFLATLWPSLRSSNVHITRAAQEVGLTVRERCWREMTDILSDIDWQRNKDLGTIEALKRDSDMLRVKLAENEERLQLLQRKPAKRGDMRLAVR